MLRLERWENVNKICVKLYGGKSLFGKKESPLEADEIYCDRADKCTFYKQGKCLRVRSFLAPTCKFGKNNVIKGYTSRAHKYYDFKNKYTNDEVYSKLEYPNELVAVIGDTLYMNLKFVLVRKKKEEETFSRCYRCVDGYEITEVGFCSGDCFLPIEDVTNELLYGIFSYTPYSMMGGVIEDYKLKVVPDIIQSLKSIAPEIHKKFIKEYPQYDVSPNYIGKYAFVKTMVNGSKLEDTNGNILVLHNGKLVCDKWKSAFVPFDGKTAKIEIEVRDDMKYKITSNSQVDENTKFA